MSYSTLLASTSLEFSLLGDELNIESVTYRMILSHPGRLFRDILHSSSFRGETKKFPMDSG
eukprot:CAMPEP_0168207492 /NCGR_PEP_ID=MMETSP0140_2-20121125/1538_1 /TAXON_ID=44445 /ORGANISM="Pseudo-nitzschia australis, Strain 10249 10 AB" /LENGTH=60 /DNA_ID=CAMNT_0008133775 /DNA_START=502 /DNA_END=680 /DNA_ORIENTATION=-